MAQVYSPELKRSPERFSLEDGRWTIEMPSLGIHPRALIQIRGWIKSLGGEFRDGILDEEYDNEREMCNIIFPEGTKVEEFDVPSCRNIQKFISCDGRVYLPNNRILAFHQHGYSDSLWIEEKK